MSLRPRPATDEESASLLAPPARDDDGDSTSNAGSAIEWDRRSLIDIAKNPKLLTTLEQGLIILGVCLLCLAAIFGGLALGTYDQLKHDRDERERTPPITRTTTELKTTTQLATTTATATATVTQPNQPTGLPPKEPPSKNDEICLTPLCVQISAAILDSIDPTVDPCDDFYQFAVGGWLATHPIPAEKGLFGAAQWIDQRNQNILLRILSAPPESLVGGHDDAVSEADKDNLKALNTFYTSCMDEDALDRRGSEPLIEVVQDVLKAWRGQLRTHKAPAPTRKSRLTDTLLFLHSRDINAFFESDVQGDYRVDPKSMRLWFAQGGLGLPSPDYYEDKEVEKVYIEVIRSALRDVYKKADIHSEKSKKKHGKSGPAPDDSISKQVFELEQKLAKISVDSVDIADPVLAYNAYNTSAFEKLAPYVEWTDYFSGFGARSFPSPVIVNAPSFFEGLEKIIEKASDEALEAYFVWHTILRLGGLLGPRETARKEVTQLNNYLSGIEEGVRPAREGVCLQSLLDNYGFMVGRYFVQQAFTGDSKEYAETIIKATIQAFKDRLPELDWLDAPARKAAEEKADAIGIKIGYATSPNVTDPVSLRQFYSISKPEKGKYFESVLKSRIADERRKWFQVGKQRDPGVWEMIPTEVNAYYEPQANEMAFPAGVLQAPYFSKDYPEYLGFGAMASLAGHELTHAFDSAGRKFDKTGKLTDWWSNETIARYEKLEECIVDQYGQYYVVGPDGKKYYVKSKATLGEDTADGGGLAQTFRAWQDRFHSDPKGHTYDNYVLPGLNYTREQLFYMQFARGWARNIKPAEAVRRIRVDEHSPTKYRVIGPLSNSDEFNKAFNCPAGSKMNRKHKCHIW